MKVSPLSDEPIAPYWQGQEIRIMRSNRDTVALPPGTENFHNFATTFEKMESSDFQLIFEHGDRMSFARNAKILKQGQRNDALYVVTQGTVRIERHHDGILTNITKLGPWSVFGEMSYLEKSSISTDVIADEFTTLIRIDGADIEKFVSQVPGFARRFYQSLAVTLSRRLRATNSYI